MAPGRDSEKEDGDGNSPRFQCDRTERRDGVSGVQSAKKQKHEDKSDSESDSERSRGLLYVQSLSSPCSSYWGHMRT